MSLVIDWSEFDNPEVIYSEKPPIKRTLSSRKAPPTPPVFCDDCTIKLSWVNVVEVPPKLVARYEHCQIRHTRSKDSEILQEYCAQHIRRLPSQHWLVLIDCYRDGGSRNQTYFDEIIIPMLSDAGFTWNAIPVEYSGRIKEVMFDVRKSDNYDGVMVMGDDGHIQECIDATLKRNDWKSITRWLPIAYVPGFEMRSQDTGAMLGTSDRVWAVFSLLRGKTEKKNVMQLEIADAQPVDGTQKLTWRLFSHLSIEWGLYADIHLSLRKSRSIFRYMTALKQSIIQRSAQATLKTLMCEGDVDCRRPSSKGINFLYKDSFNECPDEQQAPLTLRYVSVRQREDCCLEVISRSESISIRRALNPVRPKTLSEDKLKAFKLDFATDQGEIVCIGSAYYANVKSIYGEYIPNIIPLIISPLKSMDIQGTAIVNRLPE